MAWDVSNLKLKGKLNTECLVVGVQVLPVRGGVLIPTRRTLELWNLELSHCIRQWSFYVASMFAISDDQVLCTTFPSAEEIIVDTVTGDIVPTFAVNSYKLIACYKNLQLLANTDRGQAGCIKLQQLGESVARWKFSLPHSHFSDVFGCFSPKGQFIMVSSYFFRVLTYVLDVFSGNVRFECSGCKLIDDFKFISDEEVVILSKHFASGVTLRLFSVRSGDILSVFRVYSSGVHSSLATCPGEGLIAICSRYKSDLKVIKVKLSKEKKCIRNGKKVSWQIVYNHF